MLTALAVITTTVVGLMVGVEFSVAVFVNRMLLSLAAGPAQEGRAWGGRVLGRVMPFWYFGSLALVAGLAATGWNKPGAGAAVAAAALLVVSVVMSITLLVPINNRSVTWTADDHPADWREQQQRWDRLHYLRGGCPHRRARAGPGGRDGPLTGQDPGCGPGRGTAVSQRSFRSASVCSHHGCPRSPSATLAAWTPARARGSAAVPRVTLTSRRQAISADRSSAARSGGISGSVARQGRPTTTMYPPSAGRAARGPRKLPPPTTMYRPSPVCSVTAPVARRRRGSPPRPWWPGSSRPGPSAPGRARSPAPAGRRAAGPAADRAPGSRPSRPAGPGGGGQARRSTPASPGAARSAPTPRPGPGSPGRCRSAPASARPRPGPAAAATPRPAPGPRRGRPSRAARRPC